MALTPSATDPNRKAELQRIDKMAKGANGNERVKQEFNIDLKENTKIEIKETESKSSKK